MLNTYIIKLYVSDSCNYTSLAVGLFSLLVLKHDSLSHVRDCRCNFLYVPLASIRQPLCSPTVWTWLISSTREDKGPVWDIAACLSVLCVREPAARPACWRESPRMQSGNPAQVADRRTHTPPPQEENMMTTIPHSVTLCFYKRLVLQKKKKKKIRIRVTGVVPLPLKVGCISGVRGGNLRVCCLHQKITNGSFSPNTFAILVSRWWSGSALWEAAAARLRSPFSFFQTFENVGRAFGIYQPHHTRPLKKYNVLFFYFWSNIFFF